MCQYFNVCAIAISISIMLQCYFKLLFLCIMLNSGGFLGFRAAYPQLCWQHPDKLPDEEFVGVKADSGLENLLQECLYKLYPEAPSASLSPGERSTVSTRQPSSCSSCGSSSSQRSTDSGVFLTSDVPTNITSTVSRYCSLLFF